MTRFGEISPLRQKIGIILRVYLVFVKVVNPRWDNFYALGQIYHCFKSPNIEKPIWPSGHTEH